MIGRGNDDEYTLRVAWTAHRGAIDTAPAEAKDYLLRLLPG